MGRKFLVGGNWKMNGDKKGINEIIDFMKAGPLDPNTGWWLYQIIINFLVVSYFHDIHLLTFV